MSDDYGVNHCFFCGVNTTPTSPRRHPLRSYLLSEEYIANHPNVIEYACQKFHDRQITKQDRICRPCLQRANRFVSSQKRKQEMEEAKQAATDAPSPDETDKPQREIVSIMPIPGYKRIAFSTTYCIVAGCPNRQNLHRITVPVREDILCTLNIYIPQGTRVCEDHADSDVLWSDLGTYCRPTHNTFNGTQIADMLDLLKGKYINNKTKKAKTSLS